MQGVLDSIASWPWFAWVPIIAIIGGTMSAIIKASHAHQQRMAMIKQGMDPRNKGGI